MFELEPECDTNNSRYNPINTMINTFLSNICANLVLFRQTNDIHQKNWSFFLLYNNLYVEWRLISTNKNIKHKLKNLGALGVIKLSTHWRVTKCSL